MDPCNPWLIQQYRLTLLPELLQPRIPRSQDFSRTISTLHARKRVVIHEQAQVAINLPIVRIQLPQSQGHFDSRKQRTKRSSIGNDDVHATTFLVFEYRRVWLESQRHKTHTRHASLIEILRELVTLNPRRAEDLERRVSATTH